jgi:Predicted nucleic acid-binding protein, contains PIN domain
MKIRQAFVLSVNAGAEAECGLVLENRPRRREKFRVLLEGRRRVLETDAAGWVELARCKAHQTQAGREIADLDLLIPATALVHRLTVATLNFRDFGAVEGLAWEDWSK